MELSIWGILLSLLTVIVGFVIMYFLGITIQCFVFKAKYEDDWAGLSMFISFIICFIGWICLTRAIFNPKETMKYSYSYNIYALEDNMTIKGSRYYIEQDTKYYYMADYKDGRKMYAVDKNNSYIAEDSTTNPKIEVYEATPIKENWWTKIVLDNRDKEYKIIVPKKTVTDKFNVDMK